MKTRYARIVSSCLSLGVVALATSVFAAPLHLGWSNRAAVIEPTPPPPQGTLDVYSRRFVAWEEDVPRVSRSAVQVYSVDGKLVAHAGEQDGEGPMHFTLSPGDYVVASQDQLQWRRVQVEVKDGRDTVVTKAQLDTAPLFAASDEADSPTQMAGQ